MFKLQANPTFWATASVTVPGEARPARLDFEFRWLGKQALKDYFASLEGKTDEEALGEIVVGWRGVDAEFSRTHLAQLLDAYPQAAMAIFQAFRNEALEAKTKN